MLYVPSFPIDPFILIEACAGVIAILAFLCFSVYPAIKKHSENQELIHRLPTSLSGHASAGFEATKSFEMSSNNEGCISVESSGIASSDGEPGWMSIVLSAGVPVDLRGVKAMTFSAMTSGMHIKSLTIELKKPDLSHEDDQHFELAKVKSHHNGDWFEVSAPINTHYAKKYLRQIQEIAIVAHISGENILFSSQSSLRVKEIQMIQ